MVKKIIILCIVSVVLICITPFQPVLASTSASLFAYSKDIKKQTMYVEENVSKYMSAHYNSGDITTYQVGNGISINDPNDIEKVLFPVWNNDLIVATFIVIDNGNGYSGIYSEAYANQLEYLVGKTSRENALFLVATGETLYATINDQWYDLNAEIGTVSTNPPFVGASHSSIDASVKLDINPYYQTRIATSYQKNFTIYYPQGNGNYCYSYALGNILLNMGYSSYTPADIQSYMNYSLGASQIDMHNYLASKGLTCTYSTSGFMSFDDVASTIYYNDSYIYISAQQYNTWSAYHALVIFGYFSNGTNELYNIWNPWFSNTQTMDASTRLIMVGDTTTFIWNNGYLYNIHS
jgi:hypothetical protein